jgi:hypothetical protein
MRPINRQEVFYLTLIIVFLLFVTTLPYVLGMSQNNTDWRFSGFILGAEDGYSYTGKMRLGLQGKWAFHLFYSHEAHDSAHLTFLPYIIPGQLLRLVTNANSPNAYALMVTTYHVMRIVFSSLLVVVIHRFCAVFLETPIQRLSATVLICVGGGIGFLLLLLPNTVPPEFSYQRGSLSSFC